MRGGSAKPAIVRGGAFVNFTRPWEISFCDAFRANQREGEGEAAVSLALGMTTTLAAHMDGSWGRAFNGAPAKKNNTFTAQIRRS